MHAGNKVFEAGYVLAGFRIIKELGEGGMGVVYLARDERLGRKVALKVIAPHLAHDPEFQARFEAEARHAAAIDHGNAVPIYSAGSADGRFFIAMRYVEGTDLRRAQEQSGPLEVGAAVTVISEVAAALDAAHAAGLVHRDVKPANILIAGPPGEGKTYLTDFGLTRNLGATQITTTGQWIGTPDYVAPEQMTGGRVDARADIYALGCVLYEMLAGTVPFPGDEMHKLWSKANADTPPLPHPNRHHPLDPVIQRATARNPDHRFRSAGDLARAAGAATGGRGSSPTERSVATGPAAVVAAAPEPVTASMPEPTLVRPVSAEPVRDPSAAPPQGRAGGRGRSAAIVIGCVAIAAGLVAAALLATQGNAGGGGSHKVAAASRTSSGDAASATSSAAELEPTLFDGARYSVEVPAGWTQIENEKVASDGSYFENAWRSPDGEEEVLIDESPGNPADPAESAAAIGADVRSAGETIYSITDGVTYGDIEGSELDLRADSGLPERADFFFDLGNSGFAVLASGYNLASAQDRLGPVLSSLQQHP
jgi:serine/threonine-protein kinase